MKYIILDLELEDYGILEDGVIVFYDHETFEEIDMAFYFSEPSKTRYSIIKEISGLDEYKQILKEIL